MRSLWVRRADATKRPVDGLRALAVLWVIAYHTLAFIGRPLRNQEFGPVLRLVNRGHLGVDLFFVLSGFLIASLLLKEHQSTGAIGLRSFYLRRALRILPAYFVALGVYVLLVPENRAGAWANLLFVNNFLPESEQCMSWTWSLAVEEQFYIFFPAALLASLRLARPFSFILLAFGAGVIVRMLIVSHYGIHLPSPEHQSLYSNMLYNKPYARLPQLLSGAFIAYAHAFTDAAERLRHWPRLTRAGAVVALAIFVATSFVQQPIFRYGWPAFVSFLYFTLAQVLFAVVTAYLIFVAINALPGGRSLARLLSWRGFYPVSQLSYSAYLIHMIIIFVGLDLQVFPLARTEGAVLGYLVLLPIASLVAALPMYMLVEVPLMNLRERWGPTRRSA